MKIILVLLVVAVVCGIALAKWSRRDARTSERPKSKPRGVSAASALANAELLASFELTERETAFFGRWRETRIDGVRVAFFPSEGAIDVVAGDFDADSEQITDIYLSQVGSGHPLPNNPSRRLDRFVGRDGSELARRFYLNARGAVDHPELRDDRIRTALLGLSGSVAEIGIFETQGVELRLEPSGTTRESLESDVRHAVAIATALEEARSVPA